MYIEKTRTWNDGEQHVGRARFLILLSKWDEKHNYELRGLVRKVALRPCGNWMMGTARIYGHSLTVSGDYGADGLCKDLERLPEEIRERAWDEAVPLPPGLRNAWDKGGGWNCAGSERVLMREWARQTFKKKGD